MRLLPQPGSDTAAWVRNEIGDLAVGPWEPSDILGGQMAADAALAGFDVCGYAAGRNEAWPPDRRGSSGLSPYIRHGLLTLPRVWAAVAGGPPKDVERFRDELLWQEYARHVYARLGVATRRSLRFSVEEHDASDHQPWSGDEACVAWAWQELRTRGWLPNQMRMWLASHWTLRHGRGWREGEDQFYRHLLDGSRAANRLGWQWTVGALTGKPYGFSRWQVEKRAPGLCQTCPHQEQCPIQEWPPERTPLPRPAVDPRMRRDDDCAATAGPAVRSTAAPADTVWITAESLGDEDPALTAHPDLPAVFVLDEALLTRLRLSGGRLVFLAQCLADLAARRPVEVWRGDPVEVLQGRRVAATFTPVPGWRSRAERIEIVDVHPWPWLVEPYAGPVTSFTAWSRGSGGERAVGVRR